MASAGLSEELADYLRSKRPLSKRQKAIVLELATECRGGLNDPATMTARYVNRCLRAGWFSQAGS